MYLALKKNKNRSYLYLLEGVYDKAKGRSTNRVVRSFGAYDKLPKKIREQYEDQKSRKELERKLIREQREDSLRKAIQTLPEESLENLSNNFNRSGALRYGHLCLKPIWEKQMGLKYKIDYLQKQTTQIRSWRMNDLLFYLCASKVLEPKSYYRCNKTKSNYLYCPWNNIVQDNFYRGLDFVYENREELIGHAVKSRLKQSRGNIRVAFFDCTNTWFETPYDDVTWQTIRFTRQKVKELKKLGLSTDRIEAYLDSEDFSEELSEELKLREEELLRMRGCSKEGRFAQPLVTVALAIDQSGFPIDCKVYAGNLSELHTVEPMIESMKQKYGVKDIYFVADKGLNSAENLQKIKDHRLGFVVAQKVGRQTAKVRAQMLDPDGYRNYCVKENGKFCIEQTHPLDPEQARFKVCDLIKEYTDEWTDKTTGQIQKQKKKMSCKIIYTYNSQRKQRDLANLGQQVARANKAIDDGMLLGNPCGSGWRSLLQTKKEAAQNKKDKEQYRACGLKQEIIEQRKQVAGYAALVFSHPQAEGVQRLSEVEILSTYHRLVCIEDCFKVMKSSFTIHPVYVRLRERIIAHCYLCVLALMMMRSIQEKLERRGINVSSQSISHALSEALLLPVPTASGQIDLWQNFSLDVEFHDPLYTGKGARQLDINDSEDSEAVWKKYKQYRHQTPFLTDLIMKAAGLQPLSYYSTTGQLKKKLGIQSVNRELILAPEYEHFIKTVAKTNHNLCT